MFTWFGDFLGAFFITLALLSFGVFAVVTVVIPFITYGGAKAAMAVAFVLVVSTLIGIAYAAFRDV